MSGVLFIKITNSCSGLPRPPSPWVPLTPMWKWRSMALPQMLQYWSMSPLCQYVKLTYPTCLTVHSPPLPLHDILALSSSHQDWHPLSRDPTQTPNCKNTNSSSVQTCLRWDHLYHGQLSQHWAQAVDQLHPMLAASRCQITTQMIQLIGNYILKKLFWQLHNHTCTWTWDSSVPQIIAKPFKPCTNSTTNCLQLPKKPSSTAP